MVSDIWFVILGIIVIIVFLSLLHGCTWFRHCTSRKKAIINHSPGPNMKDREKSEDQTFELPRGNKEYKRPRQDIRADIDDTDNVPNEICELPLYNVMVSPATRHNEFTGKGRQQLLFTLTDNTNTDNTPLLHADTSSVVPVQTSADFKDVQSLYEEISDPNQPRTEPCDGHIYEEAEDEQPLDDPYTLPVEERLTDEPLYEDFETVNDHDGGTTEELIPTLTSEKCPLPTAESREISLELEPFYNEISEPTVDYHIYSEMEEDQTMSQIGQGGWDLINPIYESVSPSQVYGQGGEFGNEHLMDDNVFVENVYEEPVCCTRRGSNQVITSSDEITWLLPRHIQDILVYQQPQIPGNSRRARVVSSSDIVATRPVPESTESYYQTCDGMSSANSSHNKIQTVENDHQNESRTPSTSPMNHFYENVKVQKVDENSSSVKREHSNYQCVGNRSEKVLSMWSGDEETTF